MKARFTSGLKVVAGDRSFRELGRLTRTNAETVRRYMRGQAPSVEFIAALCAATSVNAHWLLTGDGQMRRDQDRADAIKGADPAELLSAVAGTIERAMDRLDRLERYVQTIETRLRAAAGEEVIADAPGADQAAERVSRIAAAVSERTPEPAR